MKSRRTSITGIVAALVATVVIGPLSSSAQAGAGAGYKLQTVQLASGRTTVARWNPCQEAITYRVNLTGLKKSKRAAMLKQVKRAVKKLAVADGITYRYKGTTSYVPKQKNLVDGPAEIVVAVVDRKATDLGLSKNALGYGGIVWSSWSGDRGEGAVVVRGYVILVPSGMASLKAGFGKGETQGNVILHELGHATGLDHVESGKQLMNPVLTSSAPNGYAAGDRAGLKKLGRSAGCVAVSPAVQVDDLS